MIRDKILVGHILMCIENVARYTTGLSKEQFLVDFMVQDAVARNIEIRGEACSKISKETKAKIDQVPWRDIVAMRNLLIHEYFRTDPETIWNVIQSNLPDLKIQLERFTHQNE
jgi:uncharacterized protein with HEPN domain